MNKTHEGVLKKLSIFFKRLFGRCSICIWGDGKWNNGRNTEGLTHLPICQKCKADGWKVAEVDDIRGDKQLKDVVDYSYSKR